MNKELLEKRRAFHEAMRARIRLIAHERNLPNDDDLEGLREMVRRKRQLG